MNVCLDLCYPKIYGLDGVCLKCVVLGGEVHYTFSIKKSS